MKKTVHIHAHSRMDNCMSKSSGGSRGGRGGGGITFRNRIFFFYYLFESKILASAGSPIITQLVDLFFDGEPFYFATNLKKSFCIVFSESRFGPPLSKIPAWIRPCEHT